MANTMSEESQCEPEVAWTEPIVWRWTPPLELRADLMQDCAEEYFITECPTAIGGIVLYAKYHGHWTVNPWNTRHVLKELLRQVTKPEIVKP
jgi:hypothetical protein